MSETRIVCQPVRLEDDDHHSLARATGGIAVEVLVQLTPTPIHDVQPLP
jgi:hypothetical protein